MNRRRKIKRKSKHGHQQARRPAHRGWKAIRSALAGNEAGQGHTLRSCPQTHRFGSEGIEGIEREFFDPGDSGNIFAPDAPVSTIIDGLLAPLIGAMYGLPEFWSSDCRFL
ncbi:MAG: hypothetical protein E5X67_34135 [Mesorhizobium sp.]|nr:MAG: hypothetical protein E5X67_34135 [Mesorhizobium sp.]